MLNVCKRDSSLTFIRRSVSAGGLLLTLTLLLFSCGGEQTENTVLPDSVKTEKPVLSFAVAGHIYGNSDNYTQSVYPPFLEQLKKDHKKHDFEFLFLTGDVLYDTNNSTRQHVESQLDSLGINWFVARGNHDFSTQVLNTDSLVYENLLSVWNYDVSSARRENCAFLVLNISNPGWTVRADKLNSLRLIMENLKDADHLFIFTHQLWWQRNPPAEFELDSIRPNSFALYDGPSDFWKDVFPYFDSTGIETWFFAGDVGADEKLESYYEDHHNQFHFYASGMGGGKADNYLIVEVYQNGHVDIEKVSF